MPLYVGSTPVALQGAAKIYLGSTLIHTLVAQAVTRASALVEVQALRPSTAGADTVTTADAGNLQTLLNAAPGLILEGGNYGAVRLNMATGKFLIAADPNNRPIFDGASAPAIYGDGSDVWIEGIEVTNCTTGDANTKWQTGAIHPNNSVGAGPAFRWKIVSCYVHDNDGRGITIVSATGPALADRSIISHCRIEDNNGNTGIGGTTRYTLSQWCDIHRNNPTAHDKHFDSGGIKQTGGRSGTGAPVGRGDIVRYNRISFHRGPGVWFDWDGYDTEVYGNNIWECDSVPIIFEVWARGHAHHNKVGRCCKDFQDFNVTAFNGYFSCQNSKDCIIEDNTAYLGAPAWLNHFTYQSRGEVLANYGGNKMPQGGVGIGWFTTTGNIIRNNTYLLDVGYSGTRYSDLYTDTLACSANDPAFTGDSCTAIQDDPNVDFRVYQEAGNPYPTDSLYGTGTNYWGYVPQPNLAGDDNVRLNNVRTNEVEVTSGVVEPDWQTIDVVP